MRVLRGLIGPLGLGLSVWCAAGTIAVAGPDHSTPRLAVAAPIWILVAAAVVAALVPAFRRRPGTAWPALLSTVAWWPVPLPPILLVFTGPLAWLPIAASVGLAVGSAPLSAFGRRIGADRPTRAPWLAAAGTLVLVTATAWSAAPQAPGGDEPHYLVATQSLLEDHDLQVENNYRQRDYAPYYGGQLDPHYLVPGKNGQIYSVHAPGLSVLVLPAFACFGYHGAEATVMLLAALTGALIWRIGWRATGDARAAWFAWGAIASATTFLIQGFTIYPDGPAMVAVAVAVLLLLRFADVAAPPGLLALASASVPLAALPWLHTRFALIAAGFGVVIAVRLVADRARPIGVRSVRLAVFAAIPLASALGWFAFFSVIYGTPNPTAPYGNASNPAETHLIYAPGGLVALLFDGQFGLLTYAPVLVVGFAGWLRPVDRASRRVGLEALAVMGLYLSVTMTYWMWWGGGSGPARFFASMLPVLALPLATAWTKGDAFRRAALVALVGISLGFASVAIGVDRGRLAWNVRDAQSRVLGWLGPVVNLRRGWPSFFWALDPDFSASNLSSEWIFVRHVALFLVVWLGVWFAVRGVRAWFRVGGALRDRALTAAWLLFGVMLAVEAGWLANGVTGIDAEPAQAVVLAAARDGGAVVGINVMHLSRQPRFGGRLTIASQEPGVMTPPPWFMASNLPAGDYDVTLQLDRAQAGTLTVKAGDVTAPHAVQPVLEQTWRLHLAADGSGVVMMPDDGLRRAGGRILITAKWGNQ
jgi:hypothetical protein